MIKDPTVKQVVFYMDRNKLTQSTVKFLIHRPKQTLYHLDSGVNIRNKLLFETHGELYKELVDNLIKDKK